jgi:hypothetical protein
MQPSQIKSISNLRTWETNWKNLKNIGKQVFKSKHVHINVHKSPVQVHEAWISIISCDVAFVSRTAQNYNNVGYKSYKSVWIHCEDLEKEVLHVTNIRGTGLFNN